jgi:hypothetical protein
MRTRLFLILTAVLLSLLYAAHVDGKTVYFHRYPPGQPEPWGMMRSYFDGDPEKWRAIYGFTTWFDRRDRAIFVHIVGDALKDDMCNEFYGKSVRALIDDTKVKRLVYWTGTKEGQSILLISTIDVNTLVDALNSDNALRNMIAQMMAPEGGAATGPQKKVAKKPPKKKVTSTEQNNPPTVSPKQILLKVVYFNKPPAGHSGVWVAETFKPYLAGDPERWYATDSLQRWFEGPNRGIFVHIIGDGLTDGNCREFYGKPISALDQETNAKRTVYWTGTKGGQTVLLVSATDLNGLAGALNSDDALRNMIAQMMAPGQANPGR